MPAEAFDEVDWDAIRLTLTGKPKMYNQWYSKQCSGWCGTGKNLKHWKRTDDARCPNCNTLEEDAGHLMVCRSQDRSRLLEEHVVAIDEWMKSHFTEPLLQQLVTQYFRGRGTRKFRKLDGHSYKTASLAEAQDKIGWRHFTEGKIALRFRVIQRYFLQHSDTRLTVDSWLKGFVSKLLAMTHAQWIFRCITKHHRTKGTIVLKATEDLLQEVERQLSMG